MALELLSVEEKRQHDGNPDKSSPYYTEIPKAPRSELA